MLSQYVCWEAFAHEKDPSSRLTDPLGQTVVVLPSWDHKSGVMGIILGL